MAPTSSNVYCSNPSPYAVMNWAMRVYRSAAYNGMPVDEQAAVRATVRLFSPLSLRVDTLLSRLSPCRSTLYRGVKAYFSSVDVAPGALLHWSSMSSTSTDIDRARHFAKSNSPDMMATLFVVRGINTASVAFASRYPAEKEILIASYTAFRGMGKLSPLLQLSPHRKFPVLVRTCTVSAETSPCSSAATSSGRH